MTTVLEEDLAPAETEAKDPGFEFDDALQRKIVALILRDTNFAAKTHGLLEPGFFEQEADGHLTKIALDYYGAYRKAPDVSIMIPLIKDAVAHKKIRKDILPDISSRLREILKTDISDRGYVASKVEEFARNKAMERAILASVELLGKGDFAAIKRTMDAAMVVGADESNEYNYWGMVEARTEERKLRAAGVVKRDGITTGYPDLDKELHHWGWGRKEMSLMMGAAKAGKSMSLGDFGKSASLAGYVVDYFTCEVSAKIIADRTDANVADVLMKKLDENAFAVDEAVKKMAAGAGDMACHEFASGSLKPSQIRRTLEKRRARGIITDLLIVDYADIMAPEYRSDNLIDAMRSIYVDLRAIAFDYDCAVLTATQTNREGAKAMTAKATDVAEDFNKIRTADLVISINATEAEKAAGEARLFIAASRNSEGEFTLRIKQDRGRMKFITKILGRE